jgi:hypothetical protein
MNDRKKLRRIQRLAYFPVGDSPTITTVVLQCSAVRGLIALEVATTKKTKISAIRSLLCSTASNPSLLAPFYYLTGEP